MDGGIVAEIIGMSHSAVTGDGAVGHQRGEIACKHVLVMAIFSRGADDEGGTAEGLGRAGNLHGLLADIVEHAAPVADDEAGVCKLIQILCPGVIPFHGHVGHQEQELYIGIGLAEEINDGLQMCHQIAHVLAFLIGLDGHIVVVGIFDIGGMVLSFAGLAFRGAAFGKGVGDVVAAEAPRSDIHIQAGPLADLIEVALVVHALLLGQNAVAAVDDSVGGMGIGIADENDPLAVQCVESALGRGALHGGSPGAFRGGACGIGGSGLAAGAQSQQRQQPCHGAKQFGPHMHSSVVFS